ncbi:MAG: hypothetical protein ACRENB_08045 [Gemmatimonadales bacterium]
MTGAPLMRTAGIAVMLGLGPVRGAAQTKLVVYQDGRVLVRHELPLNVPRGRSQHRIELEQLDVGTLVALDPGVTVVEVRYPASLTEATLLRASLGRRILFRVGGQPDTVSAIVVGDDPPRFQLSNGQVLLTAPGVPLFPPDLAGRGRPTTILLDSDRARSRLVVGYVSQGATWQADYIVQLEGREAEITGRAVVSSADIRADSAEIVLLEGMAGRASSFARERGPAAAAPFRLEELVVAQGIAGSTPPGDPILIGGFRLHPVPGRHALAPGWSTSALLFGPVRTSFERVYRIEAEGANSWTTGVEQPLPVSVRYRFERPPDQPFGARAIPPGIVRVYGRDATGGVVLLGEARAEQLDAGKPLDLRAGRALEVTARRMPSQTAVVQDTVFGVSGRPTAVSGGSVANAEVRFANASDSTVIVELQERMGTSRLISSSVPGEAVEGGITRFRVSVPARGESVLRYRVRAL